LAWSSRVRVSNPERIRGNLVTFLTASAASGSQTIVPRGAGWVLGFGVQPRINPRAAVRMEFQLVNIDDEAALRIMLGFVRGRR
jgi:hypothetical protein